MPSTAYHALAATEPIERLAKRYAEAHRIPPSWEEETKPEDNLSWQMRDAMNARIMIVDDEPVNIKVVREYLRMEGYSQFIACEDPHEVMDTILREDPDVVVLDLMMPDISGLDLLQTIRADQRTMDLPVIFLTAAVDHGTRATALSEGATDFLAKPVEPTELLPRIRNAVLIKMHTDALRDHAKTLESEVQRRTAELARSRLELLHCLGRVAEFRDTDTGRHVIRVGRYAGIIAMQMGLSRPVVELIELAAPLHDMGKIGIPDSILLKTQGLDDDELSIMRKHCDYGTQTLESVTSEDWQALANHTVVGEKILEAARSPILEAASRIALTHHERWDGTGYPLGLKGEQIPIEGRVVAVADVFDALSSKRPYKPAFPLERCFAILEEGRASHFDPKVLDAFFQARERIVDVKVAFADEE